MYATFKPLGQLKLQHLLLERPQCHLISKNKLRKKGRKESITHLHEPTEELLTEHCKNRREEPDEDSPKLYSQSHTISATNDLENGVDYN